MTAPYNIIKVILLLIIFIGCGVYSFTGHGIAGIKTIAVEPLNNQTAEFGIQNQLTDAVLNRLLKDGTLTITDPKSADAILQGNILNVVDNPLTFNQNEEVTEYQVTITVDVQLIHPLRSEPIWQAKLSGRGNYPADNILDRQEGIEEAIELLVQDLLNRLTSDW